MGSFELTSDTWEAETAGKIIFVDFFAPMCGGCQVLAPHWKSLMLDYEGSLYSGVYHVDCHGTGASLCQEFKIGHTPELRYGNASDGKKSMKKYSGSMEYKGLKKFAKKVLGPVCSMSSLQHCTAQDRELGKRFKEMPLTEMKQDVHKLQQGFKEKEKQLKLKRAPFEEAQDLFQAELKEFKSEKKVFEKAGKKLERKSGSPVTEKERAKHKQNEAKMKAKAEELEARRQKLAQEREALQLERQALDAEVRSSGLRLMQSIAAKQAIEARGEL